MDGVRVSRFKAATVSEIFGGQTTPSILVVIDELIYFNNPRNKYSAIEIEHSVNI